MAQLRKLPRNYYKRVQPPPALRTRKENFMVTIAAGLGAGGEARSTSIRNIRKILLQDLANAIVDETRAAHINITMGNADVNSQGITGWKQIRQRGFLDEEVAVIVDGSPSRPIKNVKFAGIIDIQAAASVQDMIEAAIYAWKILTQHADEKRGTNSGNDAKKGPKYAGIRYRQSFKLMVDGSPVSDTASPMVALRRAGLITKDSVIQIVNAAPYAAKLERQRYPNGTFNYGFKKIRGKWGNKLAIRFDYIQSGQFTLSSAGGAPVPQPMIMIGQPGAFPSGKPNIRKNIRNSRKQGRGAY